MPGHQGPLNELLRRRLIRFIESHRNKTGQLPTQGDLAAAGFDREVLKAAIKAGVISEFYVTLTNGTIVKGYKA